MFCNTDIAECVLTGPAMETQKLAGIIRILWHLLEPYKPLELHLTTSELWFGQEQEGILP